VRKYDHGGLSMTSNSSGDNTFRSLWLLEVRALELRLGSLSETVGVPMIAAQALADGGDSPSLRILAGMSRDSRLDEIQRLLASTAQELGFANGSVEDSARQLAVLVSQMIVVGAVSPAEGARSIWKRAYWQLSDGDQYSFSWAVSLSDSWDVFPERRPEIEALIVESASKP
jgi:hypothetical protein